MNTITITSGTLKGSHSLDYSYDHQTENVNNKVTNSCDAAIHNDLKEAFQNLIPHLALICEELPESKVKSIIKNGFQDMDEENDIRIKFHVQSFKIKGKDDSESIIISGTKLLKIGKSVKLISPSIRWDEDYKYIDELSEAIEQCKIEVNEYLNGKIAPENQIDMFEGFGEDKAEMEVNREDISAA